MIALAFFVLCKIALEVEFYFLGCIPSRFYSHLGNSKVLLGLVARAGGHVVLVAAATCLLSLSRLSLRTQWQRGYCGGATTAYLLGSLRTGAELQDLEQRLLDDGRRRAELEVECLDKVLLPFLVLFYTWQSYRQVPYKLAIPIVYVHVALSVLLIKMPLALFKVTLAEQSRTEGVAKAALCWIRQHEELIFLLDAKGWHLSLALDHLDTWITASMRFGQTEAVVEAIKTAVSYSGAAVNYLIIALYLSSSGGGRLDAPAISQHSFLCLMLICKLNELLAVIDLLARRQVFVNRTRQVTEGTAAAPTRFVQSPHLMLSGVPAGSHLPPLALDTSHHRVTWICGPNGSGKTTLVRQIAGYWRSRGVVARPDRLFILPQEPLRIPAVSWPEIIGYPCCQPGKADESIAHWLALVGLSIHRLPGTPGEWQRAHLARLLHHKPRLAILDEPCSHIGDDEALMSVIDRLDTVFVILTPKSVAVARDGHQVIYLTGGIVEAD